MNYAANIAVVMHVAPDAVGGSPGFRDNDGLSAALSASHHHLSAGQSVFRAFYKSEAALSTDSEVIVQVLLRIGRTESIIDQKALERYLLDILDLHYAVPIQDMNIDQLLMAIMDL